MSEPVARTLCYCLACGKKVAGRDGYCDSCRVRLTQADAKAERDTVRAVREMNRRKR